MEAKAVTATRPAGASALAEVFGQVAVDGCCMLDWRSVGRAGHLDEACPGNECGQLPAEAGWRNGILGSAEDQGADVSKRGKFCGAIVFP